MKFEITNFYQILSGNHTRNQN